MSERPGLSDELRRAFWMYKFRHDPEQALALVYAKDAEIARLQCDYKKLEKMWRRAEVSLASGGGYVELAEDSRGPMSNCPENSQERGQIATPDDIPIK